MAQPRRYVKLDEQEERALALALRASFPNWTEQHAAFTATHLGHQLYKYRRCKLDFIVYKASETLFIAGDVDLVKARGSLVAFEWPPAPTAYGVLRCFIAAPPHGPFALISPFTVTEEPQSLCTSVDGVQLADRLERYSRRLIQANALGALRVVPVACLRQKILLFPLKCDNHMWFMISDEHHVGLSIEDEDDADAAAPDS